MTRARTSRTKGVMGRMYGNSTQERPKSAIKRYRIFHQKEPRGFASLKPFPSHVVDVGEALSVMYETDKWYEDGEDVRYKHNHGKGVRLYEVVDPDTPGAQKMPFRQPGRDSGVVRLGKCLGFFVKKKDDGKVYEANPPGTDLFCSASGNFLGVYCPRSGWLAFFHGGSLRVEKEGIDG